MDPIILLLIIFMAIITAIPLVEKYNRRRKLFRDLESLGGDKYIPLIGTNWCLAKAGRKIFWRAFLMRNKRNRPLYRSWTGFKPAIHVMKPEHVEIVINNSDNVNKGPNYAFMNDWFGNGLLTSEKTRWRKHRKLLTPTFHFSILDNFNEIFALKSQMLADQLSTLANGKFFDIFPFLTLCSLDIICETAMGVKINAMENSDSEYVHAVYGMLETMIQRMFNPLVHSDLLYFRTANGRAHKKYLKILHGFTEKVIRERQEKRVKMSKEDNAEAGEDGRKEKRAFLDLLLGIEMLSFEDIRQEVDTFMFGGHDSSTVSSCWTLFMLGNNLDVQEKVHQELDEIFKGEERPVTPKDVLEMKYLERVIKETLRIYTVVPAITRTLSKEINVDGHIIPSGVMVVVHIHELHHDAENFPNPEKFDPDRFLPENSRKRHPFAYIPFSAGPRNCIGQKFAMRTTKTILATLLRRYRVKSFDRFGEVDCFYDIFLRPQKGMKIALELRSEF